MENNIQTQVHSSVKISDGIVEIIGPADFVERQMQKLTPIIEALSERIKTSQKEQHLLPNSATITNLISQVKQKNDDFAEYEEIGFNELEKFKNVVSITNGRIQILSSIPGNTLTKRMVNFVILYLWVRLKMKNEIVGFSELREACEKHGQLDGPHFATYLKGNRKIFIVAGDGKNLTAQLTIPGIIEAEKILQEINSIT